MSDLPIEIDTTPNPTAAVIWLHGLGADGNDFVPIVPELKLPNDLGIRFIFPNAPHQPVTCNGGYVMRSWYDIYSLNDFDREDKTGLMQSQQTVEQLIQNEISRGIKPDRIILMGFSQGGAVVLHTGLRYSQRLAGIGALSTYLPLRDDVMEEKHSANTNIPIFMAHGLHDTIVRYEFGEKSCQLLQQLGYCVNWFSYPMEHNVCAEEINDISTWIQQTLSH
jgi:phospholipase/carboxylesterase